MLTIQKANLFDSSIVEVEMNGDTKVTGELAQGLHVKVTYREERGKEEPAKQEQGQAAAGKDKDSGRLVVRRIATKVQTWPQDASRSDRKAEKDTQQ